MAAPITFDSFSKPLFLVTNRGFYCAEKDLVPNQTTHDRLFTANIRWATPFNSFEEAENKFKELYAVTSLRCVAISNYFAVVTLPAVEVQDGSR